jgi:hypothetical protein
MIYLYFIKDLGLWKDSEAESESDQEDDYEVIY